MEIILEGLVSEQQIYLYYEKIGWYFSVFASLYNVRCLIFIPVLLRFKDIFSVLALVLILNEKLDDSNIYFFNFSLIEV